MERTGDGRLLIRLLREGDFTQVLRIQAACYGEKLQEDLDSLRAKWEASPDTCFVGQMEGEVCAYVFAIPIHLNQFPAWNTKVCSQLESADCLYLHDLAILPMARSKGLSQMFLQSLIQRALDRNLVWMQLVAVQDSIGFWCKQGFEPVRLTVVMRQKLRTYGEEAVIMCKNL